MTVIRFAVAAFTLIASPALAQEWPSGTVQDRRALCGGRPG